MTCSPKLECADGRDQNIEHQSSRSNDGGSKSPQGHDCDVSRCSRVTDRRVEKRDHADGQEEQDEMRVVHSVESCGLISQVPMISVLEASGPILWPELHILATP